MKLDDIPCQEASPLSKETFIPCGGTGPASKLVWHQKDRRAYVMCASCAAHNLRNRGGEELAVKPTTVLDQLRSMEQP